MYIFKNAIRNITRSKGRNILIGLIIVIIAASSCVALSIKNAAVEIVGSYEDSFEITASLGIDREALRAEFDTGTPGSMREIMNRIPTPGIDDVRLYADSDYVTSYTYVLTAFMNSSDIEPLTNDEETTETNPKSAPGGTQGGGLFPQMRGEFTVVGYSNLKAMSGFFTGAYQIIDGAMFEEGETAALCVISDELAYENGLAVGGEITMTNPNDDEEAYRFTIAGIYKDVSIDNSSMNWFSNAANQIITNYDALAGVLSTSSALEASAAGTTDDQDIPASVDGQLSSTFYLTSLDAIEPLEAEMKAKGLHQYYMLTTNESSLEQTLKPIMNLNTFANIFILVVLLVGGTILLAVNMINIRERKYEVGVLRAIGMKKGKLAMQFVVELLLVTFASIVVGTAAGAAASVPTAQILLKNEIESVQAEQTQVAQNFGRPGEGGAIGGPGSGRNIMGGVFNPGQSINYISRIDAVINLKVIAQLMLIGVMLTFFASILSVVLIARYEPLKILSSRS